MSPGRANGRTISQRTGRSVAHGPRGEGGGHERGVGALPHEVLGTLDGRDPTGGEHGAVPRPRPAPGEYLLHLARRDDKDVGPDNVGGLASRPLERGIAPLVQDAAVQAVDQHEAVGPRRELRRRLVQRARAPEGAELDEHGQRDGRPHAVEDLRGERDVLVDHLRLLDERVGHR